MRNTIEHRRTVPEHTGRAPAAAPPDRAATRHAESSRHVARHPRFRRTALTIAIIGALAGCGVTDASHVVPDATPTSMSRPATGPTVGSPAGPTAASVPNSGASSPSTASGANGGGTASGAGTGTPSSSGLDDQTLNQLGAGLGAVDNSVNASGSDLSNPQGDN